VEALKAAKDGSCPGGLTMLDVIQTTPELSDLAAAIADLPLIVQAGRRRLTPARGPRFWFQRFRLK